MGKQRKTCENGKTQENKLGKTEESIGKQGKTQENKETRKQEKTRGKSGKRRKTVENRGNLEKLNGI